MMRIKKVVGNTQKGLCCFPKYRHVKGIALRLFERLEKQDINLKYYYHKTK